MSHARTTVGLSVSLVLWASAAMGVQQSNPGSPPPSGSANPPAAGEPAVTPPSRPALLREGAFFAGVAGRIRRDDSHGLWVFTPERPADSTRPLAEFVLLPCAKLEQMQRSVEALRQQEVLFEVTGRVLVFEQRNYLLPLSASLLDRTAPGAPTTSPTAPPPGEGTSPPAAPPTDAATLIRDLKTDVPIVRSLAAETTEPAGSSSQPGAEPAAPPRGDGTLIFSRRGTVTRTPEGGWRFVFAADASGLADPPMTILPCLLLEQLRDLLRQRPQPPILLMSGEVLAYRGRNFLLPTMYQVERPSRNLGR
ncbi:MAG: hypothetical protein HRU76_07295 [Phycisphaeraceae bacterium]|nr:MAG: hypothetical protein HRU76_07295 [Phycisphaeraceae bacterium]